MEVFWLAAAIVLVIEGLGPMLIPHRWQRFLLSMATQSPEQLRTIGGVMVTIGAVSLLFLL